ncbi:MAG: hypothetical protein PHR00_04120 [Patescibacteria group bacterium]|nr:hypothetical protein [Patescibacteria group bacterium]
MDEILSGFTNPIFVPCEQQFPDKKNYWLAKLDNSCIFCVEQGDYLFSQERQPIFKIITACEGFDNSEVKPEEILVGSSETPVTLITYTFTFEGKSIIIGRNKASAQAGKNSLSDDAIHKIQTTILAITSY